MRVRSVEGNCYFLIKRVGTYYGNAQATHPAKQIASKSGNKFHQMSFIFLQLTRRTKHCLQLGLISIVIADTVEYIFLFVFNK